MGKYLFSVLSILLLTFVLSLNVFASDVHEIASVELVKNENIYKAKVSVRLPVGSEKYKSILDVGSTQLAQGFQKAVANNIDQICKIDDDKVVCDHNTNVNSVFY